MRNLLYLFGGIAAFILIILAVTLHKQTNKVKHLELSLWEEEQPAIQNILDLVIERYEALHPGVKIRRSHYQTEDLRVQFQVGAMGGRGSELILAPNDFAGVLSEMNLIQPVEQWARMDRFASEAVRAITTDLGVSFGVPINLGNHLMLFVNKSLRAEVPETIEDLVTPTSFNEGRNHFDLAFNVAEPFWFVPFLGAFGQQPLVDKKPNLATSATSDALDVLVKMKFDTRVIPADCDYDCAETLFLDKKAAMTINGDWAVGKFHEAFANDLAIAPLPRSRQTGLFMEPMVSGKYIMLRHNLNAAQFTAAREFIEFVVSEDIQKFLARRSRRLPSLVSVLNSDFITEDPVLSASRAAMDNAQPMPMEVELRAVWDAIRPQLQEVLAGRQNPESAAKIMQQDAVAKIQAISH